MVSFGGLRAVYLYPYLIDMRKGARSLSTVVAELFDRDSMRDSAFIFFGRNRRILKAVVIDDIGMWLFTRSLSECRFEPPKFDGGSLRIDKRQLEEIVNAMMVEKCKKCR